MVAIYSRGGLITYRLLHKEVTVLMPNFFRMLYFVAFAHTM